MNLIHILTILATSIATSQARVPKRKPQEARQLITEVCPDGSQPECIELVHATNPDEGKNWAISNTEIASNKGGKGLSGPKCADLHPNCATCTPGFKSCEICHDYSDYAGFQYQPVDGVCVVVVDFDELPTQTLIPNGYRGLDWDNFYALSSTTFPGSGYELGTVSQPNTAVNLYGNPARIYSSVPFSVVGLQATPAWTQASFLFEGFINNVLVASRVVALGLPADGPTYVDFRACNQGFQDLTEFKVSAVGTDQSRWVAIDDLLVLNEV